MADKEQLQIIQRGTLEWNRWRGKNPDVQITLQEASLVGADLREANLRGANLQRARLQRTQLLKASFLAADLRGAKLQGAKLQSADLRGADLRQAQLQGANLQDARLQKANLREANFQRCILSGADFQASKLQKSLLSKVDLKEAKLRAARLGSTLFADASHLGQARGLDACVHSSPSIIDHRTLEAAQGTLPAVFLKGCGFKDWEILQAKLHDPNLRSDEVIDITYQVANLRTKGPIQVKSLFISYSREDSAFVDYIEKKLDDDGIRSWRDVHHMTAGPLEQQIERAIELNCTVLLVLSENSLGSAWVEWEVAKAEKRQRELQQQGKDTHVLCPVAIDGTWEQSKWPGPLMSQIKKYNILDFSSWQEEGAETSYQKLKAGIAKYYTG